MSNATLAAVNATATVRAYCNSGYSANNTPASPAVLAASSDVFELPAINCLPLIGNRTASIRVPAFSGVSHCCYVSVRFGNPAVDVYYLVGGYNFLAADTVQLDLTLDGFLTIGGVPGITALSGYVKRHTTATDEYGQYDQDDPMIVPSQALKIRQMVPGGICDNTVMSTILMSTLDLVTIGKGTLDDFKTKYGLTYGDGEYSVTAPTLPGVHNETLISMSGGGTYKVPCVQMLKVPEGGISSDEALNAGVSRSRSIAVDEAILDQYDVPSEMFDFTTDGQYINSIAAKVVKTTPEINFNFYTPMNKKVLYGQYVRLMLMAVASGESYEFRPEDLDTENFTLAAIGDPRPNGQPIFFPLKYKGQTQAINGMLACVRGLTWGKAPIRYDWSAGYAVDFAKYNANTNFAKQQLLQEQTISGRNFGNAIVHGGYEFAGALKNIHGAVTGGSRDYTGGYYFDNPGDIAGSIFKSGLNIYDRVTGLQNMYDAEVFKAANFDTARAMEKQEMIIDNAITAPTIAHSPTPSIRDFTGNGAILVLTTPTDADLKRFDVIYNMYGYYDPGAELTKADLTAGVNFSYVEATNVQIKTSAPVAKYIVEQAEAQLSAGIRIWNKKPDFALYGQSNRTAATA